MYPNDGMNSVGQFDGSRKPLFRVVVAQANLQFHRFDELPFLPFVHNFAD
jgi:hypothetical protein